MIQWQARRLHLKGCKSLQSVILDIFNRGSSVFAFPSFVTKKDAGSPIKSGMTDQSKKRNTEFLLPQEQQT